MKGKLTALLLAAALGLSLAGCSLAKPAAADRFVGYYVCYENISPPLDRSSWVSYASLYPGHEAGDGSSAQVLVGEKQADGSYAFPGMDGRALFFTVEDGEIVLHNDVMDVEFTVAEPLEGGGTLTWDAVTVYTPEYKQRMGGAPYELPDLTAEGLAYDLSGTLYINTTYDKTGDIDQCVWNLYPVYQTAEGLIYITEKCDGSRAPALELKQTVSAFVTANGGQMEQSVSASLRYENIDPLVALTVYQYGADGTLLESMALPAGGELPVVVWHPDAAWAVVEEQREASTLEVHSAGTVCYRPAGAEASPVSLDVILLDEEGTGYLSTLTFE